MKQPMKQHVNARDEICYPDLALCLPRILLPAPRMDLRTWPVVACDQYTSEPEYWTDVEAQVGHHESSLHLIYPELYLDAPNRSERIARIHKQMKKYMAQKHLLEQPPGLMMVERATQWAARRRGVVLAMDLEAYDFRPGSSSPIRATEATVPSRLPPRLAVRDGAMLELPHILMLVDDRKQPLMEPLFADAGSPDYEVKLMANGGSLRGWSVAAQDARVQQFIESLAAICSAKTGDAPILFAVGDGNHSFAAAKAWWDKCKERGAADNHPARYALVELLSLYDAGLRFEPIHRLVALAPQILLDRLPELTGLSSGHFVVQECADAKAVAAQLEGSGSELTFGVVGQGAPRLVTVADSDAKLVVEVVEAVMDRLREDKPAPEIDYIHGLDATVRLADRPGWCGLILPSLSRENLFSAVSTGGSLPRKSFSLGEAAEKRYYMEARKITL